MVSPNNQKLLSSFDMHGVKLKNRVVLAPMTRARAGAARMPNQLMAEYYEQRAGAGLIITEATVISTQSFGWVNTPGIYTQEQAEAWKQVVEAVHRKDTPIFMQLWHCGRASHSSFWDGKQLPVAPSAIKIEGDQIHTPKGKEPYEVPHALEISEIHAIVADYKKAAELAKTAEFDGIEIHAANGYLLDTFLQSKTNKREDDYGGSLANRFRLIKEVVEAILTVWPAPKLGIRFSPNGVYNDMGSPDYTETFTYAAKQLDSYGLAYLHLLDGLGFGFHNLGEPMTLADFKKVFTGPIMGNCGYTQETAEAAIQSGDADLISFGRQYISNPDLAERFANGWALNADAPMQDWYSFTKEGYTDFPAHEGVKVGSQPIRQI